MSEQAAFDVEKIQATTVSSNEYVAVLVLGE
jgi:hypothetical protein